MDLDALAFGAHPDDVELTCSGTLAKLSAAGYQIGVAALTAGELGTRGSVEQRQKEFTKSAEIIGLNFWDVLGLPDGRLSNDWNQKEKVISIIREKRPRIVFAPYWEDRHPDHANASHIVREAAFLSGLRKIDTGQEAFRPVRVLYYPSRYEFKPSFVVDISAHHETKIRAIEAYSSQFKSGPGEVETNISHPGFLRAVIARDRQYGSYIGVDYGEPFLVREPLKLEDPVNFFDDSYRRSFL